MCGIVGLHLKGAARQDSLGALLAGMVAGVAERGPDSAGVAVYGDPTLSVPYGATASLLGVPAPADVVVGYLQARLGEGPEAAVKATAVGPCMVVSARVPPTRLRDAAVAAFPDATVIGFGTDLSVLKAVGDPTGLVASTGLANRSGRRGLAHTRMATESAVTVAHCHPFSVSTDLCLVHNGSFSNHATIRRELAADGVLFDTDNDSEVAARFLGHALDAGDDLDKALRRLTERFDGFFTLVVTTATEFAVVRDAFACKPAIVAETDEWVAMASEYRALLGLPGLATARVFEPEPEEVYLWSQ